MNLPKEILIRDLLQHRVRCNEGIDHGPGVTIWMHPPVHRLLGWASRPSILNLTRNVWRLDQLKGFVSSELYVKGFPSYSEQATLDRLPTLLDAELLNQNGEKLGTIADFVFDPHSGLILHYLIARTDPRIPGTSRWKLLKEKIIDQQPGVVFTNVTSLDDLPLSKSSVKQDFLRKSRVWREQIQELRDQASIKLEGWLDDQPFDDTFDDYNVNNDVSKKDIFDDWYDDDPIQKLRSNDNFNQKKPDEDPWI